MPSYMPEAFRDIVDDAKKRVNAKIEAAGTPRADFAEEMAEKQLLRPLVDIVDNWDPEKADDLIKLARARSEVIKQYVDSMTPADMKMTLETLAKMEQFGQKFSQLLIQGTSPENQAKFGWVRNALRYVMGLPAEGQSSADAGKEDIEKSIAEHLVAVLPSDPVKSHADNLDPNAAYAANLLAFAKPEQRRSIVKICLESEGLKAKAAERQKKAPEKTQEEAFEEAKKELLKALCERGSLSPLEAEEAIREEGQKSSNAKLDFTDKEMQKMAVLWEEKNDFMRRAKKLSTDSYGAYNAANEMLTLTNIAIVFGYIAGGGTILLNGIANWKQIYENPSHLVRIPQVWIGALEMTAAAVAGSDQSLSEMTASKETRENWDQNKAREGLYSVVSASPRGWKRMLEENNYFGMKTLAEFVKQKRQGGEGGENLKEENITLEKFREFLDKEKEKNPNAGHEALKTQLDAIEKSENSKETTENRFKKLATAFNKLKIVGGTSDEETYRNNLAIAQGKEQQQT